ncbi:MAG: DUF1345 domain-containing protein [Mucilaginibacter polytrichastri]|nr:DUF1345 domain-containing protein [Mucilaginibacter polytrichastri]
MNETPAHPPFLLRIHPVPRVLVSLLMALLVFVFVPKETIQTLPLIMLLWDVFALVYIVLSGFVLFRRPVADIRRYARSDDGSRFFVSLMVVAASFGALAAVLLLLISPENNANNQGLYLPVILSGMLLSWTLIHTTYTFHYAHLYYDDAEEGRGEPAGGLDFPGENKPDYIDFAYFSFTIGCTFQVSDVTINRRHMRRVALVHSVISFALNAFVIALTINLVAGLTK